MVLNSKVVVALYSSGIYVMVGGSQSFSIPLYKPLKSLKRYF